jgi:DNA end-binding protein Ku
LARLIVRLKNQRLGNYLIATGGALFVESPMALRPLWKGYLKLSLVSCPIALYPAISAAERIAFRQVNRATGNRLRHQLVDAVTGVPIEAGEKGRGYEVGDNQFVLVSDEEVEAARREAARPRSDRTATRSAQSEQDEGERVQTEEPRREQTRLTREPPPIAPPPRPKVENTRTIAIERFVPLVQIDPRYYDTPYYVAPRDEMGMEAFAVIREAMGTTEYVGMGHVVLSNRERPIVVRPMGKGMLGMTLRYAHEVRAETEYFAHIAELVLPKEMLGIAERIVQAMKADFDPGHLQDRYRTALMTMLQEKKQNVPRAAGRATPARENVVSLMDVLRRSLAAERPAARGADEKSQGPRAASSRRSGATSRSKSKVRRVQGT